MTNRLAAESSPYLLQHAHNPVDWYPWGEEALRAAREQDKPIFLSIGYAACHWCHVMEHESFEDEATAEILNREFICIKVDREERPDLDHLYMQAVMMLRGGHGGWPLSAFLTADLDVFFGGTYWPPEPRHGLPSFRHVLNQVAEAYRNRRGEIATHAHQLRNHLLEALTATGHPENPDPTLLLGLARLQERQFDAEHGGFGTAPKFPHPLNLSLLMRLASRWRADANPSADRLRHVVEKSLLGMAQGGIFDHLGGGFARYSVDAAWLIPHFEKMLYDNALLAGCYVAAWRLWGSDVFRSIAQRTLDYLLRDMRDATGGFHSSEDADSEGEEGRFYVWSRSEVDLLLGADSGTFSAMYGITAEGNFEGHNVLFLPVSQEEFARRQSLDLASLQRLDAKCRSILLAARDKRIRPGRDDKVLTNWNALAIDTFSQAAIAFDNDDYFRAAEEAADFLWKDVRAADGRLLHIYRRGIAKQPAFLDDYACLTAAHVSLYQSSWDEKWLSRGCELARRMIDDFSDPVGGGFFYTTAAAQTPIARWKETHDSSTPSGNATAAAALLRLGELTGNLHWIEIALGTVRQSMAHIKQAPTAAAQMLTVAESLLDRRWLVALVLPSDNPEIRSRLRALQRRFAPHIEFVVRWDHAATESMLADVFAGKMLIDGQATAYFCEGSVCQSPVSGWPAIESAIDRLIAARELIA